MSLSLIAFWIGVAFVYQLIVGIGRRFFKLHLMLVILKTVPPVILVGNALVELANPNSQPAWWFDVNKVGGPFAALLIAAVIYLLAFIAEELWALNLTANEFFKKKKD